MNSFTTTDSGFRQEIRSSEQQNQEATGRHIHHVQLTVYRRESERVDQDSGYSEQVERVDRLEHLQEFNQSSAQISEQGYGVVTEYNHPVFMCIKSCNNLESNLRLKMN